MLMIPSNAVLKGRSCSAKNVKSTSDCQINFTSTAALYQVQIMDAAAAASIRDWY
jgi:hypothetical protein